MNTFFDSSEDLNSLSIIPNISIKSNIDKKELSSDNTPYTLSLRRNDVEDSKELNRFVKSCEHMIRHSPEYTIWVDYLHEALGQNFCALTGESNIQTVVDIHHHPVSLFVIVKSVINQYIASSESFCSFDISTKVIELHYENRVGYIPLIRSLHIKFGNGFLQLPMHLVMGDYKYFLSTYTDFIEDDDIDIINNRLSINQNNCGWSNQYYWTKDHYINERVSGDSVNGNN